MFKFNFQIESTEVELESTNKINEDTELSILDSHFTWKTIKFHPIIEDHLRFADYEDNNGVKEKLWNDQHKVKFINSDELIRNIKANDPTSQEHSDLIPAVYEGGFKIWECTWDLLNHIKKNGITFENKRVLDLGCGSGIVGIGASIEGASHVVFQDYNEEVLDDWTIPNVILNSEIKTDSENNYLSLLNSKFTFVSGDWDELSQISLLQENKFDFILTSETIYNTNNYKKLINVFDRCLNPSGVVLLAAKSYYFGVGGGTHDFTEFLSKNKFQVSSSICNTEGNVKRKLFECIRENCL